MSNSISELLQVTHDEKMKILEHYNLTEEQMIENVKIIKDWLDKNAHLPKENGEFVVTFFIAAMNPFVVTIYFHYIGMEIKENCLFFSFTIDKRWWCFNLHLFFSENLFRIGKNESFN